MFFVICILINQYHTSYFCFQPRSYQIFFTISMMSFSFWQIRKVIECWTTSNGALRANWALSCFSYLSPYPLLLYLSYWTKCRWVSVPTPECTWVCIIAFEQVLNAIEHNWTQLSAGECFEQDWTTLSESECDWMHISTDSYMKLSMHKWLWVSVNMIELPWECECECNWMCLIVCEYLWGSIECTWVGMNASKWVLNLHECAPLGAVLQGKFFRAGSNWMWEWM